MAIKLRNIKSAIHDFVNNAVEKAFELAQEQKNLYASPILNFVKGFDVDKDSKTLNEFVHKKAGKEADVPEGIQTINTGAFAYSNKLEYVTLPDSVVNVKESAFKDCESLFSVTMPCENEYGEGMRAIKESTFENCKNLQAINFPNTIEKIEDNAFRNCENLHIAQGQLLYIKDLKEIGNSAFENCKGLSKLNLDNPIKDTDGKTFRIGESAFRDCENLKMITLPKNLEGIEADTFRNCKSLADITIPESVKYIEPNAFKGCESLESVTISADLNLNFNAFKDCENLREINVETDGKNVSFHLDEGKNWADMPFAQNDLLLAVEALRNPDVKLEEFLDNNKVDSFMRVSVAVNNLDDEKARNFVQEHIAETLIYCVEDSKDKLFEEIKNNFDITKEDVELALEAEPFKEASISYFNNPDIEIHNMLHEIKDSFEPEKNNDTVDFDIDIDVD